MKVKLVNKVPATFPMASGMIAQRSLSIYGSSLKFKLVLFNKPRHLHRWWRSFFGSHLSSNCLGAVNQCMTQFEKVDKNGVVAVTRAVYDRRHFCVVGLTSDNLGMEVITHESVHAGYCFARRSKRAAWNHLALEFDEESVAYPAGKVARSIVKFLDQERLFKER